MRIKLIAAAILFATYGVPALAEVPSAASAQIPAVTSPMSGVEEEAWHTVQDWAAAWSARDAFSFLAFYSKDFKPEDGSTFAEWSKQRRAYFRQVKLVEVAVTLPKVRMSDDKHVTVSFTQSLKSESHRAVDQKEMSMVKAGGLWMISGEKTMSSQQLASPSMASAGLPQQPDLVVRELSPGKPGKKGARHAPAKVVKEISPSPAVGLDQGAEVWSSVQGWVAAWQAKDAAAFLAHYDRSFAPDDGSTFAAWAQRRRAHFKRVKVIEVGLADPSVEVQDDDHAVVSFTQTFRSDNYSDVNDKTLHLVKSQAGEWKIVAEHGVKKVDTNEVAQAEAAKAEAAKAEAAKAEAAKAEAAKAEAAKAEAAKAEAAKAEAAKAEAAKAEAVQAEAVRENSAPVAQEITDPAALGLEAWAAVQAWSEAWGARDAVAFLGHYGPAFMPEDGSTRAAWEERRRDYFKRVKFIEVGISNPVVSLTDAHHAEIKFDQSFRSDIYREGDKRKSLSLEKNNGAWQIVAEQTGVVARAKSNAQVAETTQPQPNKEDVAKAEAARAEAAKVEMAKAEAAKAKSLADAESARAKAEYAKAEVAKAQAAKAEAAKARAEAAKAKSDADAEAARAKAEMARAEVARAEETKAKAALAKADAARAKADADMAQAEAEAARIKAEANKPVVLSEISQPVKSVFNQGVVDMVHNWVSAWAAKDVPGYLSYYAADFQPEGGESLAAWETQRRARIIKAKSIELEIDDLSMELLDDNHARVRFTQHYRSDRFHDVVDKSLDLVKGVQGWKIAREIIVEAAKSARPKPGAGTAKAK